MFQPNRFRRTMSVAVGAAATLATTLSAVPAHAVEPIVDGPLDFTHVSSLVVDGGHHRLLMGGGATANGVLVTDLSGNTQSLLTTTTSGTVAPVPGIDDLSISPDGSTAFAVGSGVSKVFRLDLTVSPPAVTAFAVPVNECPDSVAAVSSTVVVFGFDCGTIGVGRLNTAGPSVTVNTTYASFSSPMVRLLAGTPARVLAISDQSTFSTAALFDVSTATVALQGHTDNLGLVNCGNLEDFAVSPDNASVLTACGGDDRDREYSLTNFGLVTTYPTNAYADAAAFSPNGAYVGVGMNADYDSDIAVFNHANGSLIFSADYTDGDPGPTTYPRNLAFSADNTQLYALATDETVTPNEVYLVTLASGSAPTFPPVNPPVSPPPVTTPPVTAPPKTAPRVLPVVSTITVSSPPRQFVGHPFAVSGTLAFAGLPAAGTAIAVSKTVNGVTTPLGSTTTTATGAFSYSVTPTAVGPVTYSAGFVGDLTHYGSSAGTQTIGARAPAALTLKVTKVKGKVYAVTAHLSSWGVNRHVLISANKKIIGKGVVNSKGLMTVHFTRKKATTFMVVFTGDANDYPARATKGLH